METLSNLEYLRTVYENLSMPYSALCELVVEDARFQTAPGGAEHHHNWKGGLVDHTSEVVQHARSMVCDSRDHLILSVAGIWHDRNKIFEYRFREDGTIEKLLYAKLIGHVAGSWHDFMCEAVKKDIPEHVLNEISHVMLAHHGRLEWRSPVEPQTRLAHILHIADMISMQGGRKKPDGPVQQS